MSDKAKKIFADNIQVLKEAFQKFDDDLKQLNIEESIGLRIAYDSSIATAILKSNPTIVLNPLVKEAIDNAFSTTSKALENASIETEEDIEVIDPQIPKTIIEA